MASVYGKQINGQTYYYLRESARVDGMPKIVSQRYLGKAEDIAAALDGAAGVPARTKHLAFGDVAAVWSMLERLDVTGIIDDAVGPRRSDAAASVGTYLALATLNRIVAPCSKLAFGAWWATTAAARWLKIPAAALDHRRFWDAMDAIDEAALRQIEVRLGQRMVTEFGLDLAALALDMTNFATFIDSGNEQAPIAQRGHAKQKRADLRLVGLGLVVTRDGGIPILSHAYPGNRPDVAEFSTIVDALTDRYTAMAETAGLSVVFDAGQNSAANFAHLAEKHLHYVGSLPPSDHPHLLALPGSDYTVVDQDRFPGLRAIDTTVEALGATRRAVLTHSANLHAKQARGFDQTLAKATRQLDELAATLARGKTRRSRDKVQAAIDTILRPRWVSRVVTWTLTGDAPAEFRLAFAIDEQARQELEDELFGKRILITDHHHWPIAEVVAGYRSQSEVEAGFRQLKDTKTVSFSPMFHWTEQKIRVHALYCVLALAVAHLMRRQAAQAGIHLSVRALLTSLATIEETVLLYPSTGGRPKARRVLTDHEQVAAELADLFGINAYAPKS
ncbi:IS1634 family transposase [Agrococcus sp. KRD186]|uniref:IS1634 family transposase n=1 Tax=Agrococcus sp. KRD186 TaxID=2729730 RepID=UPI0019D0366C|nr:IS1634 family transposase [Agrococcus sp. KRD186]